MKTCEKCNVASEAPSAPDACANSAPCEAESAGQSVAADELSLAIDFADLEIERDLVPSYADPPNVGNGASLRSDQTPQDSTRAATEEPWYIVPAHYAWRKVGNHGAI